MFRMDSRLRLDLGYSRAGQVEAPPKSRYLRHRHEINLATQETFLRTYYYSEQLMFDELDI
jgi:hypothetical protein